MTSTTAPTATALAFTGLVSVGLFGASFVVDPQSGFGDSGSDDPEFIVFMNNDATAAQTEAVREALDGARGVNEVVFLDQQAAYDEFQDLFADKPQLIDSVSADVLPPSFRVETSGLSAAEVDTLAAPFDEMPGVREVRRTLPGREDQREFATTLAESLGLSDSLVDPALIDRNIDWVLRAAAAALLVPMALLAVALKRSRPTTTAEVH